MFTDTIFYLEIVERAYDNITRGDLLTASEKWCA